jgi:hypothetical protein
MLDFIPVYDLGNNRDKFLAKVTRTCGKGNWFWVFAANKKLYSWDWGMQFYEDAYYEFFHKNVKLLASLCANFSDVYVVNRFDTDAGLDYKKQIQHRDHCDDIAIRRCLVRFGVTFKGKELLKLEGTPYAQSEIPFHLPHLIKTPDKNKSVQSWLNSNRLIAVANTIEDQAKLSEMLIK